MCRAPVMAAETWSRSACGERVALHPYPMYLTIRSRSPGRSTHTTVVRAQSGRTSVSSS
jgi:hypothetical protein